MSVFRIGRGDFARPKAKPRPKPFTMYDSVTVSRIPRTAVAVAGYVGGDWPTFSALERDFPKARRLSIAVNASEDAECLDVERGDAVNAQAPAWVKRQLARGVRRPCVYTSVSNAAALLSELKRSGIRRSQVRVWTAHYTGRPHRCSPLCHFGFWAVADATQWVSTSVDISRCAGDFL